MFQIKLGPPIRYRSYHIGSIVEAAGGTPALPGPENRSGIRANVLPSILREKFTGRRLLN